MESNIFPSLRPTDSAQFAVDHPAAVWRGKRFRRLHLLTSSSLRSRTLRLRAGEKSLCVGAGSLSEYSSSSPAYVIGPRCAETTCAAEGIVRILVMLVEVFDKQGMKYDELKTCQPTFTRLFLTRSVTDVVMVCVPIFDNSICERSCVV